jgi:Tfp pilus assembly PilM family ATPase
MSITFGDRVRTAFAPPRYLAPPLAGIDVSTSGVKAVRLAKSKYGLVLAKYIEAPLPQNAFTSGEIVDHAVVGKAVSDVARTVGISVANVALPESKSYLF